MDVHRGEQFPCGNCSKLLASRHMLKAHQKGCIQGSKFICEECGQEYATKQGLRCNILSQIPGQASEFIKVRYRPGV